MQGFIAQFERARRMEINLKYWKPQDDIMVLSGGKKSKKPPTFKGRKQIANANTIAMDILSTFRSLFARCSLALTDCSPGIVWDFSLKEWIYKVWQSRPKEYKRIQWKVPESSLRGMRSPQTLHSTAANTSALLDIQQA